MAAILLTVGLFAFWAAVGYAALGLLRPAARPLANALLAPVTGLALTLLAVFLLNRAGVPVARLGWPVAVALIAATALLLWRCRPAAPPRRYALFAASFVLALGLTGRPMLQFGLDWLSYCNGDMANYCCSASRVLHHGFAEPPSPEALTSGREYALVYWLPSVPGMVRPGAELVLAWACAVTGLAPPQAFMALMLAFHLVLVSAAGALVCRGEGSDGPALLTCGLVEASALVTLGTLYQLIAQVAGIALLAGCAAALFAPSAGLGRREGLRRGLLVGVFGAALLVLYPEILPFLAVAFVVYVAASWRRGEAGAAGLGWTVGTATAFVLGLLNTYLAGPLVFLLGQARFTSTSGPVLRDLFPYYLLPSGLAHLWGLAAIGAPPAEPWLSAATVAGAALLLLGAAAALRATWRGHPAGAVALVMIGVGAVLRLRGDGFGLFKLAMFVQPFLLAAVVTAWCSVARRPLARWAPLLVLAAVELPAQTVYLRASRGKVAYLVELPDPSESHLLTRFTQAVGSVAPRQVILDTVHPTLGTLQALALRGTAASFPSTFFFSGLAFKYEEGLGFGVKSRFLPAAVAEQTEALCAALNRELVRCVFDMHDPADPGAENTFRLCLAGRDGGGPEGRFLVCSTGPLSIFNRNHLEASPAAAPFVVKPWAEVRNYLLFTPSQWGNLFPSAPDQTGPCHPEPDILNPGRFMAGAGRHMLFEVLNPTPKARLVLELTSTLKADADNALPPACAIGAERVPLPLHGRGSARVWSPPLSPQEVAGHGFVALDLGRPGTRYHYHGTGLNALAEDDLGGDPRYMVAFLRNVSLVSEEEYAARRPPALLASFPADLLHPDLEYSGLYEDGWASESVSCTLGASEGTPNLVVRGVVPVLGDAAFRTHLRVLLDGREVHAEELATGEFKVRLPGRVAPGLHKVELSFARWQHLPGGDGRPVAAQLRALGFEAPHAP